MMCPNCKHDLQGEPIPEEQRDLFGGHTHFGREVGMEDPNVYDGAIWYGCPDCGHVWKRFEWSPEPTQWAIDLMKNNAERNL